jgi:hypothetical protein
MSPQTIEQYMLAVNQFRDWCAVNGRPATVTSMTEHAIPGWLGGMAEIPLRLRVFPRVPAVTDR